MRKLARLAAVAASAVAILWGTASRADGICYNCMLMNQGFRGAPFYGPMGMYPMPSFYPSYYPWWAGYGALSYSNFFYPGPWNMGIRGSMYPGVSAGFAAKPNLYVDGPAGTQVSVRVKLGDGSNWLAAIPAHGSKGWTAVLGKDGKLSSGGAEYRFFYYDYRLDLGPLQDRKGFCTGPDDLIPTLAKSLARSGFTVPEIRDFKEYWSMKIPPAKRYCVYPQESQELASGAALEIEPKPARVKRVLFMVVPDDMVRKAPEKFAAVPPEEWKPTDDTRKPAADGITVREWGVGFLGGR